MRLALFFLICAAAVSAQSLKIYAIDTEGGKATLYVSPAGESMLIDAGYDGEKDRDARRSWGSVKIPSVCGSVLSSGL